jgi:hypothetical protein
MARTACYLQILPRFGYRGQSVYSISAQRVTTRKPNPPIAGALVVRLTLEIPDAAFLPLAPAATIVIPADHTEVTVVSEPIEIVS